MSKAIVLSFLPDFDRDVRDAVTWSERQFGAAAAARYERLIAQALRDIAADPARPGAQARPELALNAYIYHLMYSRKRMTGTRVKAPRHFLLYRYRRDNVELARLLHDSRDLGRHVPASVILKNEN